MNINYSKKQAQMYEQSLIKLNLLQDILFDVKNIESTQRGYLLSKEDFLLKSYKDNKLLLNQKIKKAHSIFDSTELQKIQFDSVQLIIQNRISFADSSIVKFQQLDKDEIVKFVVSGKGVNLMAFVQQKIEKAAHHYMLDANRFNKINKSQINYRLGYFLLVVFFFVVVVLFNYKLIRRDAAIQKEKEFLFQQFKEDLECQVNQKTNEIKKINDDLEYSNKRFLLIAEASNVALWDWDIQNNEIWGNELYLKILNKSQNDHNNYHDFVSRIHPDDFESAMKIFDDGLAAKKRNLISEFRFSDNKGGWIYIVNRVIILYDEHNNPYRTLGSFEDVTSSKKIAHEIQKEKEISDTLINSLPGVFYMFDSQRKFIRWNKNLLEITGYTSEDMQQLHPLTFVPEDQVEIVGSKIASVFEKGVDSVEADLLTKDNRRIPYLFTGVYVRINDGEDCMMGVGIDISEKINYQQQLRDLALHLQNVREEERTIISREIHDELGQQLTGLKMDLTMVRKKAGNTDHQLLHKLDDAIEIANQTLTSVRRISSQLRPSILDDLGLVSAMEWQSEEFQKRFGITCDFVCNDTNIPDLSIDIKNGIFRIYQETLTNVLRHANATKVESSLHLDNGLITLAITDNGVGFNSEEIKEKKSLGLLGIKERTSLMKGTCFFSGKPGVGTTVLIKIPFSV